MKTILQWILLIAIIAPTFAQKKSGNVIYKVANVDFDYLGNNIGIIEMLKMARQQQYNLKFNNSYSSFTLVKSMPDGNFDEFANSRAQNYVAEYDYYFDYENNLILQDNGNGVLIEQKREDIPWVLTSETKDIDQYKCYKATYTYEFINGRKQVKSRLITAWFAPSLPYSHGPKNFDGLPGLILELTYVNITFLATSIELFEKQIDIKFPSDKRVSREEYDKQMMKNWGQILNNKS